MAVRDKQNSAVSQEIKVDLAFMSRSNIKAKLIQLKNFLTLSWLHGNKNPNPSKLTMKKARELERANYDNVASNANMYNRPF
ncbi:MAG: hypothetical protein ACW99A_07665 [Candidatus Kariarchaeaceae archaeon]|jgi:hypothetical protein